MKKVKISVDRDKDCNDFMVSVSGEFTYQIENFFDTTSIRFFLSKDALDRLAFQSNTAIQDDERMIEEENHKYREAPTAEDIARAEAE